MPLEDIQEKFSKNMSFLKFRFVQNVFLAGLSSKVPSHLCMNKLHSEFKESCLCLYNVPKSMPVSETGGTKTNTS